ncbi:MAG: hypothetical protein WBA68_08830, partial [Alteraurantiacibacter sp.]
MPTAQTASMTIAEMREFASLSAGEQEFIERSLDIALGRGDAFKSWSRSCEDQRAIRGQYIAYRELRQMKSATPSDILFDGVDGFMGTLVRI